MEQVALCEHPWEKNDTHCCVDPRPCHAIVLFESQDTDGVGELAQRKRPTPILPKNEFLGTASAICHSLLSSRKASRLKWHRVGLYSDNSPQGGGRPNHGGQSSPGLEENKVFVAEGRQGFGLSLLLMYSALQCCDFYFCVTTCLKFNKWPPASGRISLSAITNWCHSRA